MAIIIYAKRFDVWRKNKSKGQRRKKVSESRKKIEK